MNNKIKINWRECLREMIYSFGLFAGGIFVGSMFAIKFIFPQPPSESIINLYVFSGLASFCLLLTHLLTALVPAIKEARKKVIRNDNR